MKREKTLNEEYNREISDIEALLQTCRKLIQDKMEEKPKAGITFAKGKENERRFSYKEALQELKTLELYFGEKGCFSLGTCQTCKVFDTSGEGPSMGIGICKKQNLIKHKYETCKDHTRQGGGYGV